jgi:uncharacterized protein YPO0396
MMFPWLRSHAGSGSPTWTLTIGARVTDVRRWFDFLAAVLDHQTGRAVSLYQDSSGRSGGEKAKLAFTILVAAIAYQYDLDSTDEAHYRPQRPTSHFASSIKTAEEPLPTER